MAYHPESCQEQTQSKSHNIGIFAVHGTSLSKDGESCYVSSHTKKTGHILVKRSALW